MTHLRERWEGASLCGKYTLEQWLGGGESAAFFQTSHAPDGRRAVVKLVPETAADDDGPLNLWHRIRQLRHPNLVELLDCGRADLDGEIAFYALFESPDDTLASAIAREPLNPEESREVLHSVIAALRYLHAQGLAAGALDPDHIVAIGDQVKLSTGALLEAETPAVQREDVRLLGELWQRALLPASPNSAEIAAHAADPDPDTRWTLAEISAALAADPLPEPTPMPEPPAPAPLPLESPVAEPPIAESAVSEASPAETEAFSPRAMLPIPEPAVEASSRHTPEPAASAAAGLVKWLLVAAAAVIVLSFGVFWLRHPKPPVQSQVSSVSLPRIAVSPPASPATAPSNPAVDTRPQSSATNAEKIWRVIAFTFRSREPAVKKVQQLNEYHPGIDAAIFQPKERGHYYLVCLGGRMTRDDAERLRRTAHGKGLPRDLYIQNYTR